MKDTHRGLYQKFVVTRTDGTSSKGAKHDGCHYFVLDLTHDKHASAALLAYAESCGSEYPMLANDLCKLAQRPPIAGEALATEPDQALRDWRNIEMSILSECGQDYGAELVQMLRTLRLAASQAGTTPLSSTGSTPLPSLDGEGSDEPYPGSGEVRRTP